MSEDKLSKYFVFNDKHLFKVYGKCFFITDLFAGQFETVSTPQKRN